jgi:hypothetical protein
LANTQPIGFGAISALSVKTAPFDVTFGNTGQIINATKSGSNRHLVHYTLSQKRNLIGRYSDGLKQEAAAFNDYTMA